MTGKIRLRDDSLIKDPEIQSLLQYEVICTHDDDILCEPRLAALVKLLESRKGAKP
jgi:hypothetical protein